MSVTLHIDPHAHLYECYSTKLWCESAFDHLGAARDGVPVVVIVDREGQNSFERLRKEVSAWGSWRSLWDGRAGEIHLPNGSILRVIQGVQYVAAERIEVLGLGVSRGSSDGERADEYISEIQDGGGVACLPWSPGKWLGKRGDVVRSLIDSHARSGLTVGDISLRSIIGPPSPLLRYARRLGCPVLCGTDPLPRLEDQKLVGTFGIEVAIEGEGDTFPTWDAIKSALISGPVRVRGHRNSPLKAVTRFVASQRLAQGDSPKQSSFGA